MLADTILRSFFGPDDPPQTVELGLALRDDELTTPGYRRVAVPKGEWELDSRGATTSVRFGPFVVGVAFDTALLLVGGKVAQRMPMDGTVTLLPGMEYDHTTTVRLVQG